MARCAVAMRDANSDGSWDLMSSHDVLSSSSSSMVALLRSVAISSSSSVLSSVAVDDNDGKLIGPLLIIMDESNDDSPLEHDSHRDDDDDDRAVEVVRAARANVRHNDFDVAVDMIVDILYYNIWRKNIKLVVGRYDR